MATATESVDMAASGDVDSDLLTTDSTILGTFSSGNGDESVVMETDEASSGDVDNTLTMSTSTLSDVMRNASTSPGPQALQINANETVTSTDDNVPIVISSTVNTVTNAAVYTTDDDINGSGIVSDMVTSSDDGSGETDNNTSPLTIQVGINTSTTVPPAFITSTTVPPAFIDNDLTPTTQSDTMITHSDHEISTNPNDQNPTTTPGDMMSSVDDVTTSNNSDDIHSQSMTSSTSLLNETTPSTQPPLPLLPTLASSSTSTSQVPTSTSASIASLTNTAPSVTGADSDDLTTVLPVGSTSLAPGGNTTDTDDVLTHIYTGFSTNVSRENVTDDSEGIITTEAGIQREISSTPVLDITSPDVNVTTTSPDVTTTSPDATSTSHAPSTPGPTSQNPTPQNTTSQNTPTQNITSPITSSSPPMTSQVSTSFPTSNDTLLTTAFGPDLPMTGGIDTTVGMTTSASPLSDGASTVLFLGLGIGAGALLVVLLLVCALVMKRKCDNKNIGSKYRSEEDNIVDYQYDIPARLTKAAEEANQQNGTVRKYQKNNNIPANMQYDNPTYDDIIKGRPAPKNYFQEGVEERMKEDEMADAENVYDEPMDLVMRRSQGSFPGPLEHLSGHGSRPISMGPVYLQDDSTSTQKTYDTLYTYNTFKK